MAKTAVVRANQACRANRKIIRNNKSRNQGPELTSHTLDVAVLVIEVREFYNDYENKNNNNSSTHLSFG